MCSKGSSICTMICCRNLKILHCFSNAVQLFQSMETEQHPTTLLQQPQSPKSRPYKVPVIVNPLNLMEFRISMATHLWMSLGGYFQRAVIEAGRPTLNVGDSVAWGPRMYKRRKPTTQEHSPLCFPNEDVIKPHTPVPMLCPPCQTILSKCWVKITPSFFKLLWLSILPQQQLRIECLSIIHGKMWCMHATLSSTTMRMEQKTVSETINLQRDKYQMSSSIRHETSIS